MVLGAVGRAVAPERRSRALGVATAIGSFGQFVMLPGSLTLIGWLGWSAALIALAGIAASMAALSAALPWREHAPGAHAGMRSGEALREALGHNGFRLLAFGFFVCGFQVVFIITHPGVPRRPRAFALGRHQHTRAIGLANVAGAYLEASGERGSGNPRCLRRSTPAARSSSQRSSAADHRVSAYVFGIAIGLLWMSTVPLTNGTVAAVFGVRNLGC